MALETRLTQKLTTQLTLTPQLKLSIDILQLPILELAARIQQELAENPVLEEDDDSRSAEPSDRPDGEASRNKMEQEWDAKDVALANLVESWKESFQTSLNERPEDIQSKLDYLETLISKPPTLAEHLLHQYGLISSGEEEKRIAETIIGNLDENGYLKSTIEEMAQDLQKERGLVEEVLKKVQGLDPPGIAAQDLKECLILQLARLPQSNPRLIAERIVRGALAFLEKKQFAKIARALSLTQTEVAHAVRVISELEPKPGRRFSNERVIAAVPDVVILDKDGELNLAARDEDLPRLRISERYRRMLKDPRLDKQAKDFIRQKMQLAAGFIRAVDQRHTTLIRIAKELVTTQKLFLEKGIEYLKPLRLKDIARATGLHESTISRTVQNKYIETPNGVYPLKHFFSRAIPSQNGDPMSQASIKDRIRRLIDEESPGEPLSDAQVTRVLKSDGVAIARRTVAKYREELKIPPTHERRRKDRHETVMREERGRKRDEKV
ncbi:MAG: RNA polymerase factor sigma-54 [Candidatus Omnitrophica bacterium]|nr:RNA polymerase factor sigma-54 [Candidatus Omnitrophota bacterium]